MSETVEPAGEVDLAKVLPTPRIWISDLTFSDGTKVSFDKNDIVLIVGPNNSGKSAALRSIRDIIATKEKSLVVADLKLEREGTEDAVIQWFSSFSRVADPLAQDITYQALGVSLNTKNIRHYWSRSENGFHQMARAFCHMLSADERLALSNPQPSIAIDSEPPTHPMHFILADDSLEMKVSNQFQKAFGESLIVNRGGGRLIPLHVGTPPTIKTGEDRVSVGYLEELRKLPTLHTQGDGMRSFAGIALYTLVGREPLMLIDEPEAFLHPPQARQLGRILISDKPETRQLFIATHSGDVLRGVLSAGARNVRVIRLRRQASINPARQLDNAKIAQLWNDPLLRSSNILDGLFHEKVILCEGDTDARFYSAVADTIIEAKGEDTRRPDVMFTHVGGKYRLPVVIRALHEVDVPLAVVVDFDALSDESPLNMIIEAAGGNWAQMKPDWNIVHKSIDPKKPDLDTAAVKENVQKILDDVTSAKFPAAAEKAIAEVFERTSPWGAAKKVGKSAIPSGDATRAYLRLMEKLRSLGIFILEVGEIEQFVKSVGNKGPKWLNEVLGKNLATDPEIAVARSFVAQFISGAQ